MQLKVPLSRKATIERALARAVAAQGLWAAAGGTGLGRTPSARAKARMVTLLWSDPVMGADWGYLATGAGGTKFLSLTAPVVDVLPRLAELEPFVGIDWTADPARPELDPAELARRLPQALKAAFVRQATWSRRPLRTGASAPPAGEVGPRFAGPPAHAMPLVSLCVAISGPRT